MLHTPGDLSEIPTGHATALAGIMSQRLILNMRETYHRGCTKGHESVFDTTTWQAAIPISIAGSVEVEDIEFAATTASSFSSTEAEGGRSNAAV